VVVLALLWCGYVSLVNVLLRALVSHTHTHTPPGGGNAFSCFSFSENGYHVAAVAAAGVSLWDLRKMKCFK
jgi:hypothetical protein